MSTNRLRVLLVSVLAVFALSAAASASASASPFWEVCEKGGSENFEEHKCSKTSKSGEWSWRKLEANATPYNVVSKGGEQELVLETEGEKPIIKCTAVADKGNIKGGEPGTDEITELKYTGCTINIPGCTVVKTAGEPNKTIVVPTGVKTKLFETSGVINDEFTPASGTTFVILELGKTESGGKATGICSPLTAVENKVEGDAVATLAGTNLGETLEFLGEGTLTVDGIKAELKGKVTQELENGWAFRAKA